MSDVNKLTIEEIKAFKATGLLFPKRMLTAKEAADYLENLEEYEQSSGGPVKGKWRYKSHLVFPWVDELMRRANILDVVEDLLGGDIMVWTTHLYPKEPHDGRFISWHQDSAHWGLNSEKILTVWIALTDANEANGCMRMMPGSHKNGIVPHTDTWDPNNILTRGQKIDGEIDESKAALVTLKAGEASFHHVDMWHASKPNETSSRRVGVALRYITPEARQTRVETDFASLVRGEDRFSHFQSEARPSSTMNKDAIEEHKRIADIQGQINLHGTNREGLTGLIETNEVR